MITITDKTHRPSIEEISEYILNPSFDGLHARLTGELGARCETVYSGDNVLLGWNVRFFKAGKTLCRFYPQNGRFSVLIVVGRKEKERVEAALCEMSERMREIYRTTAEGMGQRWLLFDFDERDADDLLRLVSIRAGKN